MPSTRLGRPRGHQRGVSPKAAVLAIGLDRATIRNVADCLGMSVPGLYHHVRTREQLLAMAAHTASASWCFRPRGPRARRMAHALPRFVFDALVAQPELIGQITAGTVDTMRLAQHIDRFLGVLVAHGRTVSEGYDAYALLMASVTGAAAMAIGRAAADAAGHGTLVDLRHAAAALGDDETPLVHELARRRRREPDPFAVVRTANDTLARDDRPDALDDGRTHAAVD